MIQAIALNTDTLTRTRVIGLRTGDATLGIVKALMIECLKEKMRNGVAHFVFIKKDGTVREAWGTTNSVLISSKVNGRGQSRESFATTCYWDIEKGAFRSLRWESIVKVF